MTKVETGTLQDFLQKKPVRVAKLWKKNADLTTTIFHQRTFKTYRISVIGSEIWELCDGLHTLQDVLHILIKKLDEDTTWKTLHKESLKFLIKCSEARLIRWE